MKNSYEYTIFNVILRSSFCIFLKDVLLLFKNNFVYLNGSIVLQHDGIVSINDFLQIKISKKMYNYIYFSKKFLKKKLSTFRLNSWKFFKQKTFRQQNQLKPQKRKIPKYLSFFFLFKLNTPKYLEIDFFTLTICVLYKVSVHVYNTYYLNKFFSNKLFNLYNFKKIN